jgi:transcriptional regulator GlxA family with amidase domain
MERVTRRVAILIFDEVEVLDFCGPFEVFSLAGRSKNSNVSGSDWFEVYTVAERAEPVLARNGLSVNPRYTLADCPPSEVLIVPGGLGTRREMHNLVLLDWIKERAAQAELVISVCTGALLLAKAGLLDNLAATTHAGAIDLLREVAPRASIHPERRFVDNGRVLLAAGIAAGIDLSFHVVARLLGQEIAIETARHMEYAWRPE